MTLPFGFVIHWLFTVIRPCDKKKFSASEYPE